MRFSIITPSFGQSEWLKLCVASVADQGIELEHIVQHKGPGDTMLEWLRDGHRVKVFVEEDMGMYDALNRGLRRANGEIFAWLNCDEQYLPGALRAVEKYFENNPRTELLLAHAIVVDADGQYLFHRKVVRPQLGHTWTSPLSTLSCAMFFRGSLLRERNLFMDTQWRCCGDAEWLLRVLQQRVQIRVLNDFTSAYTKTGANLSATVKAEAESRRFFATAPARLRMLGPVLVLHHRLRRFLRGTYFQKPFSYSIYTRKSPQSRVTLRADKPSNRWKF
jgi:glycosyltransferase involved in cell wall biosynthesis